MGYTRLKYFVFLPVQKSKTPHSPYKSRKGGPLPKESGGMIFLLGTVNEAVCVASAGLAVEVADLPHYSRCSPAPSDPTERPSMGTWAHGRSLSSPSRVALSISKGFDVGFLPGFHLSSSLTAEINGATGELYPALQSPRPPGWCRSCQVENIQPQSPNSSTTKHVPLITISIHSLYFAINLDPY